jgi:hypothetical protein
VNNRTGEDLVNGTFVRERGDRMSFPNTSSEYSDILELLKHYH